jgi:hypothetical protein
MAKPWWEVGTEGEPSAPQVAPAPRPAASSSAPVAPPSAAPPDDLGEALAVLERAQARPVRVPQAPAVKRSLSEFSEDFARGWNAPRPKKTRGQKLLQNVLIVIVTAFLALAWDGYHGKGPFASFFASQSAGR